MKETMFKNGGNTSDFFGRLNRSFKNVVGVMLVFILIFIIMSFGTSSFLTTQNIYNVIRQIAVNIFLTCGMTLVILVGGIDLSVGSIIGVSACLSGGLIAVNGLPVAPAILIAILGGTLVGAFNGAVISTTRIPPFIVTLAVMFIGRGFARIYTHCTTILVSNDAFSFIGTGKIFGNMPVHIIYVVVVCVIASLLLNRTKLGRNIYAIGNNEQAAIYAGIHVRKVKFLVYLLSGLFAACAGVLSSARIHAALFNIGEGTEMDAISAVILGGTSMSGGVGTIGGSIFGALIIGVISNGMNLFGIDSSWQYVVKGCVLLLAVYLDFLRKNKDNTIAE